MENSDMNPLKALTIEQQNILHLRLISSPKFQQPTTANPPQTHFNNHHFSNHRKPISTTTISATTISATTANPPPDNHRTEQPPSPPTSDKKSANSRPTPPFSVNAPTNAGNHHRLQHQIRKKNLRRGERNVAGVVW
ncbi:hypothetical protein Adt_09198 [Abeliophyllum distichum]|uniref:Uncharacterized protein n=1 Tax=Abeliophyllum distichum TaxID=126358 RepID=A0ABD1UGI7_9LAMI